MAQSKFQKNPQNMIAQRLENKKSKTKNKQTKTTTTTTKKKTNKQKKNGKQVLNQQIAKM